MTSVECINCCADNVLFFFLYAFYRLSCVLVCASAWLLVSWVDSSVSVDKVAIQAVSKRNEDTCSSPIFNMLKEKKNEWNLFIAKGLSGALIVRFGVAVL